MKTLLICAFFISTALHAQTAYTVFRTTITCPLDKKELAVSANKKIESVLTAMTKEGVMVNFNSKKKDDKDNVKLIYTIPSENEESFKKIIKEWKARASASDPQLFSVFWQTCPSWKDTIASKHKMMFPLIRSSYSGVVVVNGIDEKPDPMLDYKIVFDFTAFLNQKKIRER